MVILNVNNEKPVTLKENQRIRHYANLEGLALRNVVQDSWRAKVKHDKHLSDTIDQHTANMQRLFGSLEYEAFSVQNIIANTKNMSRAELSGYIRILEGLAYFYNNKLGNDVASTLLTGLTMKAKTLDSLNRYYRLMVGELDSRIKRYDGAKDKESRKIERLDLLLKYNEASFLSWLLKKRQINGLRTRISTRRRKLARIDERAAKERKTLDQVNRIVKGQFSQTN
ncbi:MAG: hypothetical protein KGH59_01355 [Candidatus Micrarchaeota archaeon]|nr:hypothetical protein [Candidatus Micrarchaeota archaeon]MDE1804413.1 hypothetical protein [Candidatus Micrarchaeota archaeon]MDE1846919.1 hypothetical protein [Candidatus Micrarchaeota archaeon]